MDLIRDGFTFRVAEMDSSAFELVSRALRRFDRQP